MKTEFASLYDLFDAIPDEPTAIAHFTAIRWKHGAFCPYCGSEKVYHFKDGKTHKCGEKECRQRFSIKVGTVFEDTKIGLRKWLAAIWLITSHKKGIASAQLARDIAVTQKTAWFMLHRLRHAARTRSFNRRLKGDIEIDETYVGGKERNKHANKRTPKAQGGAGKVIVMGLLERGGELRAGVVPNTKRSTLQAAVRMHVEPGHSIHTDELRSYQGLAKHFAHYAVNHTAGEYVREGTIHTNSIEGVWSLLRRQIYGIHHFVSAKHLWRYVNEAVWRYNRRAVKDGPRVSEFLSRVDGRLRYVDLIAKA